MYVLCLLKEVTLSDYYIKPLIVICSFFKDAFDEYKLTNRGILITNIFFSIIMSFIYGFILGFFALILGSIMFKFETPYFWYVIWGCIGLVELIQLNIISIFRSRNYFFPEIYLNSLLMSIVLVGEKIIVRQFLKALALIFAYFMTLSFVFFTLSGSEYLFVKYMSIILSISVIVPVLILSKEPISSFINSAKVMVLQIMLSILYFVLILMIVGFNSDITNLEINAISVLGLIFTLQSILQSLKITYEYFVIEYEENIHFMWNSLKPEYGFTKYRKKYIELKDDFVEGIELLKIEWKRGIRLKFVLRFVFVILIIIVMYKYKDFISSGEGQNLIEKVFGEIASTWIALFKGDKEKALITFVLLAIIVYWGYSINFFIRNKRKGILDLNQVKNLALSSFVFFPLLGLLPAFDFKICMYISGVIMLFIVLFGKLFGL